MKKKMFIGFIITILLLLIISGAIFIVFLRERDNKISLIKDQVVVEYGNPYNPNKEELIDLSKYSFMDLEKLRIETNIENEQDKSYPAVGEYEINVYYKNKNLKQKIEVIDTISPELSIQDTIEIPFGTDLLAYNFKERINVSDLSELKEYNIDFSKVNSSLSGEYVAKITVEDIYSNKTEKEFKIVTQEKAKEEIIDNPSDKKNNTNTSKSNAKFSNKGNTNTTTNNNSNNSKPNTSTKPEESNKTENKPETPNKPEVVRCTNNSNHAMGVGNSNQWFSTKNEAISYYNSKLSYWGKLWEAFRIDDDTYYKNCPSGYEIWSCMYCSKWTINFYYR